jgi:hypothetical protein
MEVDQTRYALVEELGYSGPSSGFRPAPNPSQHKVGTRFGGIMFAL